MNNKWSALLWDALVIACVIAIVGAVVILAINAAESACGTPGDISCPPAPYPVPSQQYLEANNVKG